MRRPLHLIATTAERATALTRQLLAFSRKQVLEPEVLDLSVLVAGIGTMLRRLIGEDIELVTTTGRGLGRVKADPAQLEQVLLNLAVNARDAMPRGGRLTIDTGNVEFDAAFVSDHPGATAGRYVMLSVGDTGVGMDAATQAHIVEPFFTTKGPGKGTGLGLATVYGIVKQHGGYITVSSEPGRGTAFKIYLPRTDEATQPVESCSARAEGPRGVEVILLVEDEGEVRNLAKEILQTQGYTLLEAGDGTEALRIAAEHEGPIDLLLTDVVMPRLGGRDLADRMASERPETKVLYMSGYPGTVTLDHGVLPGSAAFLQKPFTADLLARKVREVLDRRGSFHEGHTAVDAVADRLT